MDFKETPFVGHLMDKRIHIVGNAELCIRKEVVQFGNASLRIVIAFDSRRLLPIVGGEVRKQPLTEFDTLFIIFSNDVGASGLHRMSLPACEVFEGNLFARLRLHEGGTSDSHEAGRFTLDKEIVHDGMVSLSTETGAEKQGNLGHDSRCENLGTECPSIGLKRVKPFLQTRSAGIVDANKGPSFLLCEVAGPYKLLSMIFSKGSCHRGEIFRCDHHVPTVNFSIARDDPFSRDESFGHSKLMLTVFDERPCFNKGSRIHKHIDSFTGVGLSLFFAFRNLLLPSHFQNRFSTPHIFVVNRIKLSHQKPPFFLFRGVKFMNFFTIHLTEKTLNGKKIFVFTFLIISDKLYTMKDSSKARLALVFLALACFIGVLTVLIVNSLVTNQIISEAQERVKEHLGSARWIYESKIRDIEKVIRWTSVRHILRESVKRRNVAPIRDELQRLMAEEGLDFLTLTDRNGRVLFRFHNPEASGDSLNQDPFVKAALSKRGLSGTQIVTGPELMKDGKSLLERATITSIPTPRERPAPTIEETSGMVLKSAHPVLDLNGEVLGVLTGGILLNRNYEIVDRIKDIVFKDARYKGKEVGTATIFLGDLRISTNVKDREGNRAVGTRAMKEVQEQVLGKGIPWIQRAFVVDDWYITAYEPIVDVENKIVGMLYVGMMESKYAAMKERLILLFFLFSMSAMLFAFVASFALSWKILRKRPDR